MKGNEVPLIFKYLTTKDSETILRIRCIVEGPSRARQIRAVLPFDAG